MSNRRSDTIESLERQLEQHGIGLAFELDDGVDLRPAAVRGIDKHSLKHTMAKLLVIQPLSDSINITITDSNVHAINHCCTAITIDNTVVISV